MPEKPKGIYRRLPYVAVLLAGSMLFMVGQATVAAETAGIAADGQMLLRPPHDPGPADAACVTCHEQHNARADCTTCHTTTHTPTTTDTACTTCHEQHNTRTDCTTCHTTTHGSSVYADCTTCHDVAHSGGLACFGCHPNVHGNAADDSLDPNSEADPAAVAAPSVTTTSTSNVDRGTTNAVAGGTTGNATGRKPVSFAPSFERRYLGWIILIGGLALFAVVFLDSRRILHPPRRESLPAGK